MKTMNARPISLAHDISRDAVIAGLAGRGIQAFKNGLSNDICLPVSGSTDILAYQCGPAIRFTVIGQPYPKAADTLAIGLMQTINSLAELFGLCETGDKNKYACDMTESEVIA